MACFIKKHFDSTVGICKDAKEFIVNNTIKFIILASLILLFFGFNAYWYLCSGLEGKLIDNLAIGFFVPVTTAIVTSMLLYFFTGIKDKLDKFSAILKEANERGNSESQYNLGVRYDIGDDIIKRNPIHAYKYYAISYINGNIEAQGMFEYIALRGSVNKQGKEKEMKKKDIEKAQKLVEEWVSNFKMKDEDTVQHRIGYLYEFGNGAYENYKEARKWYERAAKQGNADAQCALGKMHEHGMGVSKNAKKAQEWYEKAAMQEHTKSQILLGMKYHKAKDYQKAEEWYKKAAEQWDGVMEGVWNHKNEWFETAQDKLVILAEEMIAKKIKGGNNLKEHCKKSGYTRPGDFGDYD